MTAEGDPANLLQSSLGVPGSIILILALILFNAFFAMAEISLVSIRRTRVKQLVEEGVSGAKDIQRLLEDPTHFWQLFR